MERFPDFVIFDLDGTLADSNEMWSGVIRTIEARHEIHYTGELAPHTETMTILQTAAAYEKRFTLCCTAEQLAQEIREEALRRYITEVGLKPGVLPMLDALDTAGIKYCVASGTDKPLVDAVLRELHVLERFAFTVSCRENSSKLEPEIYLRAMCLLGAQEPAQVMVCEDSPAAFETARGAGFLMTAVHTDTYASHWKTMAAKADLTCRNWNQWLKEAAPLLAARTKEIPCK